MIVYRISRESYAKKLDGEGASRSEINRWNSKGTKLVYTSESEALARAELAGHINLALVPDLVVTEIEIPDKYVKEVKELPDSWKTTPPGMASKWVGDDFVREENHLSLKVPSRYDNRQFNLLLNPNFPDFGRLVRVIRVRPLT